ncbi:MAG: response regulator transcription factor [Brachybacterium sp.]|nr:response regulator transcription factor [Brachybacterium sp.]
MTGAGAAGGPAGRPEGGSGSGGDAAVRVLLVDDEGLMRSGLRLMIDGAQGIAVVGEAADGAEAIAQVQALDPDVVLMDLRMPRMTGIEATAQLRADGARARVVVLTAFDADDLLVQALRAGADSFLLKDAPPQEVVAAVCDAAAGTARFSPAVLDRLVRIAARGDEGDGDPGDGASPDVASGGDTRGGLDASGTGGEASSPGARPHESAPPSGVTEREWEVGQAVARGRTNAEICAELYLSLPTVKTHIGRLFDKLHVTNRVQLAIRVLEHDGRA